MPAVITSRINPLARPALDALRARRPQPIPRTMFFNDRYAVVTEFRGRFYWAVFRADKAANRVFFGELIGSGSAYNQPTAICSATRCR